MNRTAGIVLGVALLAGCVLVAVVRTGQWPVRVFLHETGPDTLDTLVDDPSTRRVLDEFKGDLVGWATPDLIAIHRALLFAADWHAGQFRKSGDRVPYAIHPVRVAHDLVRAFNAGHLGYAVPPPAHRAHAEWRTDGACTWRGPEAVDVVVAALLHDVLEDTSATPAEIEAGFGACARALVEEVTCTDKAEQVRKAPDMSQGAQWIKLADRTDNIRDLLAARPADWTPEKAREYCLWGSRLRNAMRGASLVLEDALEREVARCFAAFPADDPPLSSPGIPR